MVKYVSACSLEKCIIETIRISACVLSPVVARKVGAVDGDALRRLLGAEHMDRLAKADDGDGAGAGADACNYRVGFAINSRCLAAVSTPALGCKACFKNSKA